jgi:hypothetical protein
MGKGLGQLTNSDRAQVTATIGSPSGLKVLIDTFRKGHTQKNLEAQIQHGLDYVGRAGKADMSLLRGEAGGGNPLTNDYLDALEQEIYTSRGGDLTEAQQIRKLRKATREIQNSKPRSK